MLTLTCLVSVSLWRATLSISPDPLFAFPEDHSIVCYPKKSKEYARPGSLYGNDTGAPNRLVRPQLCAVPIRWETSGATARLPTRRATVGATRKTTWSGPLGHAFDLLPVERSVLVCITLLDQGVHPLRGIASAKSFSARMEARSHAMRPIVEFDPVAGINCCRGRGRMRMDLDEVPGAFAG
jgi:hypothetical protein